MHASPWTKPSGIRQDFCPCRRGRRRTVVAARGGAHDTREQQRAGPPRKVVTQGQAETPQGRQAATNRRGPLRAAYFGCIGGLVIVATVYGLVAEDAYRMVST